MGQLRFDGGAYEAAAEDWFSSAACFLLANADKPASEVLAGVQRLVDEEQIAAERSDLHSVLKDRLAELGQISRKTAKRV